MKNLKHKCTPGTWFVDGTNRVVSSYCHNGCGKSVPVTSGKRLYEAYLWGRDEGKKEAIKAIRQLGTDY